MARKAALGVFVSATLAILLPLVGCGGETRSGEPNGDASRGRGGSIGATGGSDAGSGVPGGATGDSATGGSANGGSANGGSANGGSANGGSANGGSANGGSANGGSATGGSATGGSATGGSATGGSANGGSATGGAGGGEQSVSFHWVEATEDHRQRAAGSTTPAFMRTGLFPHVDAPVLIGFSELIIGMDIEQVYNEGLVWTAATGTMALGGLPGVSPRSHGVLSQPLAVSADGSVVVGVAENAQQQPAAFLWTESDGMEAIAGDDTRAVAVSADGSVVLGEQGWDRLFLWTRALGAATVVEPFDGDDRIHALALSADGTMVLGESYREDESAWRLFVWTEGSGARAIENLPDHPWCVVEHHRRSPSHGFVASGSCYTDTTIAPFLWTGQDQLGALGAADSLGAGQVGHPQAISADGSVAVGIAGPSAEPSRAYRWTEASGLELLELPDGYTSSDVARNASLSEDGSVVVGTMDGIARRAFRWSEGVGATVLLPLEEHDFSEALVVSADGSVVAGNSGSDTANAIAVYWDAGGVPHRIREGVAFSPNTGGRLQTESQTPGFYGRWTKDESNDLGWFARLP